VKKILILGLFTAFQISFAYGQQNREKGLACDFSMQCVQNSKKFTLEFTSKSQAPYCDMDDMQLYWSSNGKKKNLNIPENSFFPTHNASRSLPSICEDYAVYELTANKVVLFVKVSDRPNWDHVLAIVLDTKEGKILDHKDLGKSKNVTIGVLKSDKGFKLRLVRDSLSVRDQISEDTDAAYIEDWMKISVTNGKISSGWLDESGPFDSIVCDGKDQSSSLIGKKFKNDRSQKIEKTYQSIGLKNLGADGTVEDPFTLSFWLICGQKYVLLFDNKKDEIIADAISVPSKLNDNKEILPGSSCMLNGKKIENVYALTSASDGKKPINVIKAWSIDANKMKFIELSGDNISCSN